MLIVSAISPDASKPSGSPYTAKERKPIMRPRMFVGALLSSSMDIVTIVNDCAMPTNASTPSDMPNQASPLSETGDTTSQATPARTATAACHATEPIVIALPPRSMLPSPAMIIEPTNAPAEYAPSSQPKPVESVSSTSWANTGTRP